MNSNSTYLDRIIKTALTVFTSSELDPLDVFPENWPLDRCNLFLDNLLEYCAHPDREMWEQAAIIRDVKEEINKTW
jgi:hypothetical protein